MGPHPSPERPVLNERTVRELLARQFPELRIERVEHLEQGGARAFQVNGHIIVRFAVDDVDSAKMRREAALLAELAPKLPLAVPTFEFVGEASDAYPFTFVGYQKIDGLSGEAYRPAGAHWPRSAAQFGEFLSALHAFPLERARAYGIPEAPDETFGAEYRVKNAADLLRRVRDFALVIRKDLPDLVDEEMERYLSGGVAPPPTSPLPPVLCHADLKGEHIIVSGRGDGISGVIDWTDVCITDPLLDFTGLMIWLGEPFVRQVLTSYSQPVDGHFLDRVCFYARCFSLDNLGWRLTSDWAAPLELLMTQTRWAFRK